MKRRSQVHAYMPTLGQVVLFLALSFIGVTAVVTTGILEQIRDRATTDLAREEARQVAELAFIGLYSAMRKGWTREDISTITTDLNRTTKGVRIRLFRGQPVIRQFGDVEHERVQREADAAIQSALRSGEESLEIGNNEIRYLFPVKAREECRGCHTLAQPGDVNGVIDVTYEINDLKVSLGVVLNIISVTFMGMLILLAVIFYLFQRRFVARPIGDLARLISEIIEHMDLSRRVRIRSRIAEIAQLKNHFNRLLGTIDKYQALLERANTRDPLTGLYNRAQFREEVTLAIRRHRAVDRGFCILQVDIDHFKHINDLHGPTLGDIILKQLAAKITAWADNCRAVARLGGDSFGVLLNGTDCESAQQRANALREQLMNSHFGLENRPVRLLCCFGIAAYPRDGDRTETLCAALDLAMTKAKGYGRNRIGVLDYGERHHGNNLISEGDRLLSAIEEDRLVAKYEPIVDSTTNRIFAYEALARVDEAGQLVEAHKFIQTAEQLGISEIVDQRIIECGLRAKQSGVLGDAKLFFNLSARSLADERIMSRIKSQVREHRVAPTEVVFEITEREALPHLARIAELIEETGKEGYAFALDDFGSGFSSFMYLKYLAVDYVKIEGSFVRQILNDSKDRILVRNISRVIEECGLSAIAEFVESDDIERIVSGMGIHYTQGYLYKDRAVVGTGFEAAQSLAS